MSWPVRGLSLLAWPLAVLGPLAIWDVMVAIVATQVPDVVIDGRCHQPWGACATSLADAVTGVGHVGRPFVLLVTAPIGLAVARGMPTPRRLGAVLALLLAEVVLAALVGVTVVRMGTAAA